MIIIVPMIRHSSNDDDEYDNGNYDNDNDDYEKLDWL